jgi:hypothetical protein
VKTYQLCLEVLALHFVTCLVLVGASFLVVGVRALLLIGLMAVILLGGYGRVPFEVRILPDRSVEFRSLLKRTVIRAEEIVAIDARVYRGGLVLLAHRRGVILLTRMLDEFPDLIARLVSLNPKIRVGPLV